MKKIITAIFVLTGFALNAQSFYKGALVADLNYGIDVYKVTYTTQIIINNKVVLTDKTTDGAASKGFGIGAQYGLAKWFGLGLRSKFDNFYTSPDSTSGVKASANSFEIGAICDFHVVRREHFNLALGLDLGYSHLRYKTNDPSVKYLEMYGDGSWVNFHITPRYYFGRFGLSISLNFPKINYSNMTTSNDQINRYAISQWSGSGFGMNFGLAYRFLNEK